MLSKESRERDFPSLSNMVYLNTSAEGIPPQSVLEALRQYGEDKLTGMDGRLLHQEQWEQAKSKVAQIMNLNSENIGICSCSSEAYNLVAQALRIKDGDEIIINDLDFPSGTTPWRNGLVPAVVKVWRNKGGVLDIRDLENLLSPKTRLVNTSLISFYNGYRVDVDEISQTIRRHSNSMLAVDVTQALARIPLEVASADLVISSTHKWLLASHGGGLVGVSPERADEWSVPAGGWFNVENAFEDSVYESVKNKKGAAGFMVGMPNYPAIYAISAALTYILKTGVLEIDQQAKELVSRCRAGVAELPVELLGPVEPLLESGIVAFKHPKYEEINNELRRAGIHTMSHAGRIRASIHGYNTETDIETFLETLKSALTIYAS